MASACQCSPECRLPADEGHAYCLAHDPTPGRAEERRQLMSKRGTEGARKRIANRAAAREDVAAKLSLRTDDEQLTVLETALRNVLRRPLDAAKVAAAVATLVKVAREVIHGGLEDKADRLAALLDANPELKKRLTVVK